MSNAKNTPLSDLLTTAAYFGSADHKALSVAPLTADGKKVVARALDELAEIRQSGRNADARRLAKEYQDKFAHYLTDDVWSFERQKNLEERTDRDPASLAKRIMGEQ